ncbi:MAG: VOC family protein [Promethearchaeota archaeon]|jgi:catechol 2,3-dioxygenase-like lactoylglutathione lyase family enzyme
MMKSLPWHHVHITLPNREEAAKWHEEYTLAKRTQPTKRSENLYIGPNLLQIQGKSIASKAVKGYIDSIGLGVLKISDATTNWQSAGGSIDKATHYSVKVRDPWGVPFELIESPQEGYTHINIATNEPQELCDWYEKNLGGTRVPCEWDKTRVALKYDTMLIVFNPVNSTVFSTTERNIDHIGWYTDDVDAIFHQLSGNGVYFPGKPRDFGPVRLAFAEDPCGIWIELHILPKGGKLT